MAKVAIIGAGFAGHTAALYLGHRLGREHEIIVINKFDYFLYLPSLIWVSVGHMAPEKVSAPLRPTYDKVNVRFVHGAARSVHPDENYITVEEFDGRGRVRVAYDYLIIATGPKLNWEATPGLGPHHGPTLSICWLQSTIQCREAYLEQIERMKRGQKVKMVIGAGHPETGCQGAAFEHITNIHMDLVKRGLRDRAELTWLSNEPLLGDFGVGGVRSIKRGRRLTSEDFIRGIFEECGIKWEIQKGVKEVDHARAYWEDFEGRSGETEFDFAMLMPQFTGQPLNYVGSHGQDVSKKIVNDKGFVIVDGHYGLPYDILSLTPEAWPATYQNPNYRNIFAAGIAFAVPGPISAPHITPKGTNITPAPARSGMISGAIGRLIALNIISLVEEGRMSLQGRMTEMFAACIASMGHSLLQGSACTITVFPAAPNFIRYQNDCGRDTFSTHLEKGLAGAWLKRMLHTMMLYKARANLGWQIIPE